MKLTVIGSIALDSVKTPHGDKKEILGGSATFSSISASFFSPVNLVSIAGSDFPKKYIDMFEKRKISTKALEIKQGKTFRWSAEYNEDMSHATTLSTHLNVFDGYKPTIPAFIKPSDNLFLANIDPNLQSWIFKQIKPTGLVACDTMNLWIEHSRGELLKLLKKVDIFLLNDAEARQLSGEKNLLNAAKYIQAKGAKMVVIKKGEHGALFFSKGLNFIMPAFILDKFQDPTGAGDTFGGGMLGYLSSVKKINDTSLRKACVYGTILASFTVQKFSAEGLLTITKKDINSRYKKLEKLAQF